LERDLEGTFQHILDHHVIAVPKTAADNIDGQLRPRIEDAESLKYELQSLKSHLKELPDSGSTHK